MTNIVGTRARPAANLNNVAEAAQEDFGITLWEESSSGSGLFLPTKAQGKNGAMLSMLVDSSGSPFTSAGNSAMTVGGTTPRIVATMNCANAAGAYAAGNIIASNANGALVVPITFTSNVSGRTSGRITGCRAVVTPASGNLVIANLDFELILFRNEGGVIPFAAGAYPGDRSAMVVTAAAMRDRVCSFRFSAGGWTNGAGTLVAGASGYQSQPINSARPYAPFNCAGLTPTLPVAVIQVLSAWAPTAIINQFDFALDVDLD